MFTQGGAAFGGFNATDLAVRPGHLQRLAALRSSFPEAAQPKGRQKRRRKEGLTERIMSMSKARTEMVDRLHKSVAEIMASDVANKDELLAKSFEEFGEALEAEPVEAQSDFTGDPMVDFAATLGQADEIAEAMIGEGHVDEATAELLSQWAAMSDIVLRHAIGNRIELVPEDEEVTEEMVEAQKADGISYAELPLAKSDDGEDVGVLVRTDLPAELANLVAAPEELHGELEALGWTLLKAVGHDVDALMKFDPAATAGAPPGDPAAAQPDAVGELANQLQVLMRLNAAALVQGEAIMRAIGGDDGDEDVGAPEDAAAMQAGEEPDGDEAGPDTDADGDAPEAKAEPKADAPPAKAEPKAEPKAEEDAGKKKPPFMKADNGEDLAKAISIGVDAAVGPLKKALEDAQATIAELKARPVAPKGPAMALSKGEDNGGTAEDREALAKRLAGMSEKDRAAELVKMVHSNPIRVM